MKHNVIKDYIARQYSGRRTYGNYDDAIKRLKCHLVGSFMTSFSASDDSDFVFTTDAPVYTCKFCPSDKHQNIIAIANENGTVCLENTSIKNSRSFVQTHNNTVFDVNWVPNETQFATVSGDHSAKLWDVRESQVQLLAEFLGHNRSVKCISFKPQNTSVFATGSRDGSLILWDTRSHTKCLRIPACHRPDQVIPSAAGTSPYVPKKKYCPPETSKPNSVTGIIFQDDNTLLASGCSEEVIRVWDMRKTYSRSMFLSLPRHQLLAPEKGFSHLCVDPAGTKLYANCLDSHIYCFNINSYDPEPISAFRGHENSTFYIKSTVSPDGLYLLSGSGDKHAYVWNTAGAELSPDPIMPLALLPGHNAEVTCVGIGPSGDMTVATCSDDGTYRLWFPHELQGADHSKEPVENLECREDNVKVESKKAIWRNKRVDRGEVKPLHLTRSKEEACNSKICRFVNCKASHAVERTKEVFNVRRGRMTPMLSPIEERTPPRVSFTKLSSKRKLADMPGFTVEEQRGKQICRRPVLSPIKEKRDNCLIDLGLGIIDDDETLISKLNETSSELEEVETRTETLSIHGITSPTLNLPNYVLDGTSPYSHTCSRTIPKENIDWLTKLRKEKRKYSAVTTPEEKRLGSGGAGSAEKCHSDVRRKLLRPRSGSLDECRTSDMTLLNYFKVATQP